jgi:hypothetical protein
LPKQLLLIISETKFVADKSIVVAVHKLIVIAARIEFFAALPNLFFAILKSAAAFKFLIAAKK